MKKTPFEAACKKIGISPDLLPGVEGLPEITAKRIIAGYKLEIIEKATNGEWVPDFSNYSQYKYTGWLQWSPSLGALVFRLTVCTVTSAYLGARFWFEDRNTAEKFTKDNIDLINDLHRL
jgi:hypothetical protein